MTEQKINPKLAVYSPADAGYGHRLFLPASSELLDNETMEASFAAHDLLKQLSCWRGSDKEWIINGILHLGYEFSKRGWDATSKKLDESGFTFKPFNSKMIVL
jgi:hypothetical protein